MAGKLIGLLVVTLVSWGFSPLQARDTLKLPEKVEAKVNELQQKVEDNAARAAGVERVKRAEEPGFRYPIRHEFRRLFQDSTSGRNASGQLWLIGCQTEIDKRVNQTVVSVFDSSGYEILGWGDESFEDGVLVNVDDSTVVVPLVTFKSRDYPSKLCIFDLQKNIIFQDLGYPTEERYARPRFWESMYYFDDLDDDGRKEMLINRRVHTRIPDSGSKFIYTNEKLVFELASDGKSFRDVTDQYRKRLVSVFRRVKTEPGIPQIGQPGIPYEEGPSIEFGEPIFPEEAKRRNLDFSETAEPDGRERD